MLINEFASETVGVCWMHSWVSTAKTLSRLCALVTGNICPAFQALVSKLLLLIMYVAKWNKEVSYMGRNLKVKWNNSLLWAWTHFWFQYYFCLYMYWYGTDWNLELFIAFQSLKCWNIFVSCPLQILLW